MNNNRNSTYSPFTFGKLNGVSASSVGKYTEVKQDKSMLRGIEPLPLMKDGRRDNTVTIKKYYKEGYSKQEVNADIFQGTHIEGFENSADKNLNAYYSKGLLEAIDPRHRQRAERNLNNIDVKEQAPPARSLDGKPITDLIRFKELSQSQLRPKNEISQRFDAPGVSIEAGQKGRGRGQNPDNSILTKQTKQHRELDEKDMIKGFSGVKGPVRKPEYQESNSTRSNDSSYAGPVKMSEGGKGIYMAESLENYQEYNPENSKENNYIGPVSSVRTFAKNGITSVSRSTIELDHFGPARFNKGFRNTYDDVARGTDQVQEINYSGISGSLQRGQYIKPQDEAKQTDREMEREYFTGPGNETAGLVQKSIHERVNQPHEHYTPNTGPGRFNKGIVHEYVDGARGEDKSQETSYHGTGISYNQGLVYNNNDQLRETYGGQEQEYYTAPNNQDRGYIMNNEHQRLGEIKEHLVPNLGPGRNNKGVIHKITDGARGEDKSNETNYIGGYRDSNFTYKGMQDEPRETNIVLVEDYKGNSSAHGPGQSRDAFENITINNSKQDVMNRQNIKLFGGKSMVGSSKDTIGYVKMNTLKESEGSFGPATANVSNTPEIINRNIRGKELLQSRSNINQHTATILENNPLHIKYY